MVPRSDLDSQSDCSTNGLGLSFLKFSMHRLEAASVPRVLQALQACKGISATPRHTTAQQNETVNYEERPTQGAFTATDLGMPPCRSYPQY